MNDNMEEQLCALLRLALRNASPEGEAGRFPRESDWTGIVRLARLHGVDALAFDGAMRLPVANRPPRETALRWGANAEAVRLRHRRYRAAAAELAAWLEGQGVPVMQLKGGVLADCYPDPELREAGDIDIYAFGRHDEADRLARERGIPVERHNPKHSLFPFRHIPVENHATLLDADGSAMDAELEKRLGLILAAAGAPGALRRQPGTGMLVAPPDLDALFLMRHATAHFVGGNMTLRHLCDWCAFLSANGHALDREGYLRAVEQAGLRPLADAFTALAVDRFGLDPVLAPAFGRDRALERRIAADLLPGPAVCAEHSPWGIVRFKYRRMKARRWKVKLVHGRRFGATLLRSAGWHLTHPRAILKLQ